MTTDEALKILEMYGEGLAAQAVETLRARCYIQNEIIKRLRARIKDLETVKLTIGGVEARYPTYTKMLAIIETHPTPAGVCITVQP